MDWVLQQVAGCPHIKQNGRFWPRFINGVQVYTFFKVFSAKSAKVFSKQILTTVFLLLGIARKIVFVLKSRVAASVLLHLCVV